MLRRNLGLKMLALVISVIIWAYANLGENPRMTREIRAQLGVVGVEAGYVVTDAPQTIKVTLQGQRNHVESIVAEPDSVTASVRLPDKKAGHYVLPVKVHIPEGLKALVRTTPNPREVAVTIEEKAERMLPVDVQFASPPPVGYRFGGPKLSPSRAAVAGTAEQVDSVSQLVAAVDARSAGSGIIDSDILLVAKDNAGRIVRDVEVKPAKVRVRLQLLEAAASRIVYISPDISGQPAFPCKVTRIEVSPQTIAVTGRPDQLSSISTIRTEPVSVNGRTSTFTQRVRVIAPKGLALGDNRYVHVTVGIVSDEKPAGDR